MNWPTVVFCIFFVIAVVVELTRYQIEFNFQSSKITAFNFYHWFQKEYQFTEIKKMVFYPHYLVIFLPSQTCCWYLKPQQLRELQGHFTKSGLQVTIKDKDQVFSQFF